MTQQKVIYIVLNYMVIVVLDGEDKHLSTLIGNSSKTEVDFVALAFDGI